MERLMRERPDGENQKLCAIICAGMALMLALFAGLLPTERYGEIIARNITIRYWLLVASGGLVQLAALFWLTAIIVRAMWFLPGRETSADSAPSADRGSAALIFGLLSLVGVVALCVFWGLARG